MVLGRLPFEFALSSDKLYKHIAEGKWEQFWTAHAAAMSKVEDEKDSLVEEFKDLFEKLVTI